jgi:hypothetical protein
MFKLWGHHVGDSRRYWPDGGYNHDQPKTSKANQHIGNVKVAPIRKRKALLSVVFAIPDRMKPPIAVIAPT